MPRDHIRRRLGLLALLVGSNTSAELPRRLPVSRQIRRPSPGSGTLLFSIANSINGGLVGAVGPSLLTLKDHTGLSDAALGRLVLVNRLAKLGGTALWTLYARSLEANGHRNKTEFPAPKVLLSLCLLTAAACALSIASPALRSSPKALQVALAIFGVTYGITDPAFTMLTIWSLHSSPTQQRTHIGYLNAGYTLGALATPAIVAIALSFGGDCYACFYALAAASGLASFALALSPAASHEATLPPPPPAASAGVDGHKALVAEPRHAHAIVASMACVLFCVTGCEHGVATWLPTYGQRVGGVPVRASSMISSSYWAMICLGRVIWAAASHLVTSGFAVLGADATTMLVSALAFFLFSVSSAQWLLWAGALTMAVGFASSLPCAITLPAEAGVRITPPRLLAMSLAGSAGEMLVPFLLGTAFDRGMYDAFAVTFAILPLTVLVATGVAYRAARE